MTTEKSTIVSAQYSFASTLKDGIHVLQTPVPEVIELLATAPLVKDFNLTYQGTEVLVMKSIYWSFVGTGNITAGAMKITHRDNVNAIENIVNLTNLANTAEQGFRIESGFLIRPNDVLQFSRTQSYQTQNTNNFISILCERCINEVNFLRVS